MDIHIDTNAQYGTCVVTKTNYKCSNGHEYAKPFYEFDNDLLTINLFGRLWCPICLRSAWEKFVKDNNIGTVEETGTS